MQENELKNGLTVITCKYKSGCMFVAITDGLLPP